MKKQIITCDHCGAEIDEAFDYCGIRLSEFNFAVDKEVDLCRDCYQELSNHIEEFCKGKEKGDE